MSDIDELADSIAPVIQQYVALELASLQTRIALLEEQKAAVLAEAKAAGAELRARVLELEHEARTVAEKQQSAVASVLAQVRDGRDGEPGPAGKDADEDLIAKLIDAKVQGAFSAMPMPKDGAPGEKGEPGAPGKDAVLDTDFVRRAIAEEVAALELPKGEKGDPGEPGQDAELDLDFVRRTIADEVKTLELPKGDRGDPGEPGLRGQDADPETIRQMVAEAVAALPPAPAGPPGEKGDAGAPGLPGSPGMDADLDRVDALISEKIAALSLPPGPAGEKGEPGKGADLAVIEEIARDIIATLPREPGPQGPPGQQGVKGDPGEPGEPGKDGVGMAGAMLSRSGDLVITCSDGKLCELGVVVGKDGKDGRDGVDGKDGAPGAPGRDGLGIEDMSVETVDERSYKIRFARGDHVVEHVVSHPVSIHRGVYKAGATYEHGDNVSFGGSTWHAMRQTTAKPGENDDWRLAVKKGRDGRDGEKGEKGDPGKEGPRGRDWTAKGPV